MFKTQVYNKIAPEGLALLTNVGITVSHNVKDPDAILVRSQKLHDIPLNKSLLAIGRAGAGVNNIPVDKCTEDGVVVFNTPGANANAVKELCIASLLLSARDIIGGIEYVSSLSDEGDQVSPLVEQNKGNFKGIEIQGKTLGVIGLGAIGVMVANAAAALGMKVLGHDPFISVDRAWGLSRNVKPSSDLNHLLSKSDFITLHMPLTNSTKEFLNKEKLSKIKPGSVVINLSRPEIVNNNDVLDALNAETLRRYVTDFPTDALVKNKKVIPIPHLGASTKEAEDNCAIMISNQIKDYLENGNITNSVNFPNCDMARSTLYRLCILNKNIPNMVGQITGVLAEETLNISNMLNKSSGEMAYTIVDVENKPTPEIIEKINAIPGVIRTRLLS